MRDRTRLLRVMRWTAALVLPAIAQGQDNGDAPAPFPVCSHTTTSTASERLGATRTSDVGNPVTPAWTGDASDDGVTFPTLMRGQTNTVTVNIQNFFSADALAIWADWNENGSWNDSGERVIHAGLNGAGGTNVSGPLVSGNNFFNIAVPTNAGPLSSNAPIRVRLWDTSDPGVMDNANPSPADNTIWGEVEDSLIPVQSVSDSDGDGMADSWELMFFPNLTNANATSDFDMDGFIDLHEFLAATVPTNANSLLRMMSIANSADTGGLVIQWQSASNRAYTVRRGGDLAVAFTGIASNRPATPPMNIYTDALSTNVLQFYRIDLE